MERKLKSWQGWLLFGGSMVVVFVLGLCVSALMERRAEVTSIFNNRKTVIKGIEARNELFKNDFPREYQTWAETAKTDFQSEFNGNVAVDVLEQRPNMVILWAGYAFSKDYSTPRGHMHAIEDITASLRTGAPVNPTDGPQPSTCWTCKSPDVPRMMEALGVDSFYNNKWGAMGAEIVNPIGCSDCHDPETDVVILTGEGRSFVAGADIAEMSVMKAEEGRRFGELGAAVFRKIELMAKPVIAAVNGFALGGGCELAMACDIRIASAKAKFGQPEVGLGITPGFSGTQRLPRLVGLGKAKELIYTAAVIHAEEACRIGLVNKVVESEELMNECMAMAKTIAAKAPLAVRYAKEAINRGVETDMDTGIVIENGLFGLCFATTDQKEGMEAFLWKRKPEFEGN